MRVLSYYEETIVDGPGLRFALYFAGCRHACPGCHNKETWSPAIGENVNVEKINHFAKMINSNPYLDGVTLSGGDPFYNPEELLWFLKEFRAKVKLPILVYTGYTIEQLYADDTMKECLMFIDMVMDGRFEKDKRFPVKSFRGSWNQRLILLEKGEIVKEL